MSARAKTTKKWSWLGRLYARRPAKSRGLSERAASLLQGRLRKGEATRRVKAVRGLLSLSVSGRQGIPAAIDALAVQGRAAGAARAAFVAEWSWTGEDERYRTFTSTHLAPLGEGARTAKAYFREILEAPAILRGKSRGEGVAHLESVSLLIVKKKKEAPRVRNSTPRTDSDRGPRSKRPSQRRAPSKRSRQTPANHSHRKGRSHKRRVHQ